MLYSSCDVQYYTAVIRAKDLGVAPWSLLLCELLPGISFALAVQTLANRIPRQNEGLTQGMLLSSISC